MSVCLFYSVLVDDGSTIVDGKMEVDAVTNSHWDNQDIDLEVSILIYYCIRRLGKKTSTKLKVVL